MLAGPFLTDLDSRAQVKGSRDPLGIQQIWTRLGRHVIGNLTTVSNSVRDFTTLLLGYYFAALLAEETGPGSELSTFLKWEQLAAYARATANKDYAFRGTERVKRHLSDGEMVTISDDRAWQILGNQKIYGLWGLYTMPARASGLVDGEPTRLTPPVLDYLQQNYLPKLENGAGKGTRRILDLLRPRSSKVDVGGREAPVIHSIGSVLRRRLPAKEKEFYRFHLLYGGPADATDGRQQQLAALLDDSLDREDFSWSTAMVGSLAKNARSRGEDWHALAYRLGSIRTSETLLAPISTLFTHLLGLDGKSMDSVVKRVREAWGNGLRTVDTQTIRELRGELSGGDSQTGDRWIGIAESISKGDYAHLIDLLIEQNQNVMASRGGAPWLEKRGTKLHVRFRDEQGSLPSREELSTLWRFPYFLDSLRSVAIAVKEN